jgi:hypothetical protein
MPHLCDCGCGQPTTEVYPRNRRRFGVVVLKGQPRRYIQGHHRFKKNPYIVDEKTGCWVWQLYCDRGGYARITRMREGRHAAWAHRYFYEKKFGPVPEGKELDHVCNNRKCVNPDHLQPVTRAEHKLRTDTRRRQTKGLRP